MSEQKELTPQTQQTINKLSLRITDVLEEINNVIKAFQTELKALAKKHDEVSDILLAFYDGVEIHDSKIEELEAKICRLEKQIEKLIGRNQND